MSLVFVCFKVRHKGHSIFVQPLNENNGRWVELQTPT